MRVTFLALALSFLFSLLPVNAQARLRQFQLDIPRQPLNSALKSFADQTGFQVARFSDRMEGSALVGPVQGEFSADDALKSLLSPEGLSYRMVNERTVVVLRPVAEALSPAKAKSTSQSNQESDKEGGPGKSVSAPFRVAQGNPGSTSSAAPVSTNSQRADTDAAPTLEEVIVTSERRAESASRVPISLTALTQQTMDDLHVVSVPDLAAVVPGLDISPPSNFADRSEIAIRGIYSNGNAPTTQLYIDETPIAIREMAFAYSKSPFPNIFDLDRIEVLRGPQGTLFGSSAMGGAIRFVTPQPSLTESSGFAKADIGYTEHGDPSYEAGVAFGAPIATGIAGFRVSGWFQSLGGFIDREDGWTGQRLQKNANVSTSFVVRPSVSVTPVDNLNVTTALFWQRQHNRDPNSYWATDLPIPEAGGHVWGGIDQPYTDDLRVTSLSIKYSIGNVNVVSDTSYLDRTSEAREDTTHLWESIFDLTPFPTGLSSFVAYEQNNSRTNAWQEELRVSSGATDSRVNAVAGLFFRSATQTLQQLQPPDWTPLIEYCCQQNSLAYFGVPPYTYNGQEQSGYAHYQTRDTSEAVFGDLAIKLLTQLKLDVGVRIEHEKVADQTQFNVGSFGYFSLAAPDVTSNPVTPRVSLAYQLTDDDMVYASAAKGYRPGGGNNLAGVVGNNNCTPSLHALGYSEPPGSFRPDSLWSYELGTKDRFFDRHLSVEASVYYIRWSNVQQNLTLTSCGQGTTINQGEVISKGADLQLVTSITPELSLRGQLGYTDAYYPHATYGAAVPDANGVLGPPPLLNARGDKLPNVNPWSASAVAEYKIHIDPLWKGAQSYIRLDYRWFDSRTPYPSSNPNASNYDPAISPYPDPAYSVLNVRLGLLRGGLDLSAYVNNATNSDPRLGLYHDVPNDPLYYASAIRPRTVGVTGWYRF